MKLFPYLNLALLLLFATGCSSVQVVMTGLKKEPISIDMVNNYSAIPTEAVGVAYLKAKSPLHTQGAIDNCLEQLKVTAAELGANGIHISQVEQPVIFINGFPIMDTFVSASAFYFANKTNNNPYGVVPPSNNSNITVITTPNNAPPPTSDSVIQQPNAYGNGVHMDQYGKPVQIR